MLSSRYVEDDFFPCLQKMRKMECMGAIKNELEYTVRRLHKNLVELCERDIIKNGEMHVAMLRLCIWARANHMVVSYCTHGEFPSEIEVIHVERESSWQ